MTNTPILNEILKEAILSGKLTITEPSVFKLNLTGDPNNYTLTNVGKGYAPTPAPTVAEKPIHECNLLDYQKACKAFFARQGRS